MNSVVFAAIICLACTQSAIVAQEPVAAHPHDSIVVAVNHVDGSPLQAEFASVDFFLSGVEDTFLSRHPLGAFGVLDVNAENLGIEDYTLLANGRVFVKLASESYVSETRALGVVSLAPSFSEVAHVARLTASPVKFHSSTPAETMASLDFRSHGLNESGEPIQGTVSVGVFPPDPGVLPVRFEEVNISALGGVPLTIDGAFRRGSVPLAGFVLENSAPFTLRTAPYLSTLGGFSGQLSVWLDSNGQVSQINNATIIDGFLSIPVPEVTGRAVLLIGEPIMTHSHPCTWTAKLLERRQVCSGTSFGTFVFAAGLHPKHPDDPAFQPIAAINSTVTESREVTVESTASGSTSTSTASSLQSALSAGASASGGLFGAEVAANLSSSIEGSVSSASNSANSQTNVSGSATAQTVVTVVAIDDEIRVVPALDGCLVGNLTIVQLMNIYTFEIVCVDAQGGTAGPSFKVTFRHPAGLAFQLTNVDTSDCGGPTSNRVRKAKKRVAALYNPCMEPNLFSN